MVSNLTRLIAGLTCLLGVTEAAEVPCYGYGSPFGTPSDYIVDDMEIVKELKIGQNGTYVAYIKFLFERTNYIQFSY